MLALERSKRKARMKKPGSITHLYQVTELKPGSGSLVCTASQKTGGTYLE